MRIRILAVLTWWAVAIVAAMSVFARDASASGAIVAAPTAVQQVLLDAYNLGKTSAFENLINNTTRAFKSPAAAVGAANGWKAAFPAGAKIAGVVVSKVVFPLMAIDMIMAGVDAINMNAPAPPGWSGPNSPPTTGTGGTAYGIDGGVTWPYATLTAACIAWWPSPDAVGSPPAGCSGAGMTFPGVISTKLSCPSGYVYQSSPSPGYCALNESDPVHGIAKWPSDGIATGHERDPDPMPTLPQAATKGGLDENGHPQWEQTKQNADKSIEHTRKTQLTQDGVDGVLTEKFITDAMGNILNDPVTFEPNKELDTATGTVTGPGGTAGSGGFPTDYARELTLQATNTKLDEAKADREADKAVYASPGTPREIGASINHVWDKLKNKFVPPEPTLGTGACPVISGVVPVLDMSVTFDQHCQLEPMLKPTIQGVMLAAWALLGIIIVLRA